MIRGSSKRAAKQKNRFGRAVGAHRPPEVVDRPMSLRRRRRLFCTSLSPPLLLRPPPLTRSSFLSSLPSSETTLHEYQRGHAVFEQGDPVDGVDVILQGCVEVSACVDVPIHVHQVLFLRSCFG